MDPEETLDRIRKAVKDYRIYNEELEPEACADAMYEIMDAAIDLVAWIDKGGYRPWRERNE